MRFSVCIPVLLLLAACHESNLQAESSSVDFDRDVRPILAKHCLKCHGPDADAREAGLRLDEQQAAWADLGGYAAIVPGQSDSSEVIVRITSEDDDLRMPPSETGAALSESEITVLRNWIDQGGRFTTHWALLPPTVHPIPQVNEKQWCRGSIDRFVLEKLETADISPAPPTDRESLIRRLYLDLVGTVPTPDEVERFVNDPHPAAKRKLIDRLLASPQYGERFARSWLDLARYSDTNGYEKDRPRSIWPYRDWVIAAINDDMPFDQFSIEQLAGDMLPSARLSQRIATGFHRNTMLNEEGGIDPLEYRFHALVDRVNTTGTVWLGMTVGCAQCHTHKYDPITQTDYYGLMGLMNHADEPDIVVEDETRQQQTRDIERQIDEAADGLIRRNLPSLEQFRQGSFKNDVASAFQTWFDTQADQARDWVPLRPSSLASSMPKLVVLEDDSVLASGDVTKRDVYRLTFPIHSDLVGATALRLEVLPDPSLPARGPGMAFYEGRRGDFFLSELTVRLDGHPVELKDASHSFGKISVGSGSADAANVIDGEGSTGWSTSGAEGQANQLVVNFAAPISSAGELDVELLFERHFAAALGRFRVSLAAGPTAIASKLPVAWQSWLSRMTPESITEDQYTALQKHFVLNSSELADQRKAIERLQASIPDEIRTLGMQQRSPEDYRSTFRHHRGEYLQAREPVEPGIPEVFRKHDTSIHDRLEMARWLVSADNPLVGRVTMNRAWREFFGVGMVDTAGDFGTQSPSPSHPALLDYLALDFLEHGWSIKRMHRKIVGSATYQQSVGMPPAIDPDNRLLSTFPHRRLNAEQIRDNFLSAAGLLSHQIGGPSVYPPQPKIVMQMAYGNPAWQTSQGGDRYRRSIYTFSKRTAPFAAYATFDGPTGEVCLARRDRSTTPLQALTLLNDAMYLEIAEALAQQAVRDAGPGASDQRVIDQMFRRLLSRGPDPTELAAIGDFLKQLPPDQDRWMLVARALINTDEAITVP